MTSTKPGRRVTIITGEQRVLHLFPAAPDPGSKFSHDLRNLLTTCIGYVGLAQASSPPALISSHLERTVEGLRRIDDLLRTYLPKADPEQSGILPQHELTGFIRDIVAFSSGIGAATFELQTGASPIHLPMDRNILGRAVHNILRNAVEAARESEVATIAVSCRTEARAHPADPETKTTFAIVEVLDNGCGMSEEQLRSCFSGVSSKSSDGSRGFGMASVLDAVAAHNGFMEVFSEPGQFTSVQMFLPCLP